MTGWKIQSNIIGITDDSHGNEKIMNFSAYSSWFNFSASLYDSTLISTNEIHQQCGLVFHRSHSDSSSVNHEFSPSEMMRIQFHFRYQINPTLFPPLHLQQWTSFHPESWFRALDWWSVAPKTTHKPGEGRFLNQRKRQFIGCATLTAFLAAGARPTVVVPVKFLNL